jgi:hypothetical protein
MKTKILLLIIITNVIFAQPKNEIQPRWVKATGVGFAKEPNKAFDDAINKARANALKELGITIKAGEYRQKTEDNESLVDFYSSFSESSTRGLIIEEKIVNKTKPEIVQLEGSDEYLTKVQVDIEALVAPQVIDPDPTYKVEVFTERIVYNEMEPVQFRIFATKDGYLTIFNIKNDTLNVIFPNQMLKDNFVKGGDTIYFPPKKSKLRLRLLTSPGQARSDEMFIAILTKENIPFDEGKLVENSKVKFKQAQLSAYAKWLYQISPDRRTSDIKVLSVVKK